MSEKATSVVPEWDLSHLRTHLQWVVDLELWTIPYYMTALYSIKNPAVEPYRLIQSVVYQEMLHCQLASNLANAFGLSPTFTPPVYGGPKVPHINFNLDEPNPTAIFTPSSTKLGALDEERVNTMCLIEYPEWRTGRKPDVQEDVTQYGSIGEFYQAVRVGVTELRRHIRGGVNQVDEFKYFYNDLEYSTITMDGEDGYQQALELMNVIVEQGEGQTEGDADIPEDYRNTADGYQESWPHFRKFLFIREQGDFPETFSGTANPEPGSAGHAAQQNLIRDFGEFMRTLDRLFSGRQVEVFGAKMAKIGGEVLTCWQNGAIPRFS